MSDVVSALADCKVPTSHDCNCYRCGRLKLSWPPAAAPVPHGSTVPSQHDRMGDPISRHWLSGRCAGCTGSRRCSIAWRLRSRSRRTAGCLQRSPRCSPVLGVWVNWWLLHGQRRRCRGWRRGQGRRRRGDRWRPPLAHCAPRPHTRTCNPLGLQAVTGVAGIRRRAAVIGQVRPSAESRVDAFDLRMSACVSLWHLLELLQLHLQPHPHNSTASSQPKNANTSTGSGHASGPRTCWRT